MEIVTSIKFGENNHNLHSIEQFALKHNLKLIVYSKKDGLSESRVTRNDSKYQVIELPDYGRCDYAFLYHIVANYDHLPDHILFTKANYDVGGVGSAIDHSIRLPLTYQFILMGSHLKYQVFSTSPDYSRHKIPPKPIDVEYHRPIVENTWMSYMVSDIFQLVFGTEIGVVGNYVGVGFGQGPCFRCSKKLIRRHPIAIYQTLLDIFHPDRGHFHRYPAMPLKDQLVELGKRYHDRFTRSWALIFTYGLNLQEESDYTSYVAFKE